VLIFGRSLLEGMGAALIMPAIVALVATIFAAPERPQAYGLAGAVLISALTSSFVSGIAANEAMSPSVTSQAQVARQRHPVRVGRPSRERPR
jgi:MFS family permease